MYIQNATYKTVPTAGLTFPLAEGTVLTVGDVTGIVPENISLAAPTGLIYLAVGGTIDLTSEANAGVSFTDAEMNSLGGDFNFVPKAESSALPSYTSADNGKVLTVTAPIVVPEQTIEEAGMNTLSDCDWSAIDVGDVIRLTVTISGDTESADSDEVYRKSNGTLQATFPESEFYGTAYLSYNPTTTVCKINITYGEEASATIKAAKVADPAVAWKTPAASGAALIIKATGEAEYSDADGFWVEADVDKTTFTNCFLPDTAKPVYALFPVFSVVGDEVSYSYDDADGNYMMPLSKTYTSVPIDEYETYTVDIDTSGRVFLLYTETSN